MQNWCILTCKIYVYLHALTRNISCSIILAFYDKKINQILFAYINTDTHSYLWIYISVCVTLRQQVLKSIRNLRLCSYLYEFSLYRNLYVFANSWYMNVKLSRTADIRHTFLYALSCTKFIHNCMLLNVPDCNCICGYITYQFLFMFEQMLSVSIIYPQFIIVFLSIYEFAS